MHLCQLITYKKLQVCHVLCYKNMTQCHLNLKYNLLTMQFSRDITSALTAWGQAPDAPPLILHGARQVGKTWALKELGNKHFSTTHYLNFERDQLAQSLFAESIDPNDFLRNFGLLRRITVDRQSDLFIFDEIQACPRALTSLKYFAEDLPGLKICAAGSWLGIGLSAESAPVGKVQLLDMYPLTFREYLRIWNEEAILEEYKKFNSSALFSQLITRTREYLTLGGLPDVVKTFIEASQKPEDYSAAFDRARQVQDNLVDLYLFDMAKHAGKANALHLERIWRSLPARLAEIVNGGTQRYRIKDVIPGIASFSRLDSAFDWLTKAGLIYKSYIIDHAASPLIAQAKETLFKLFCFDTGILGCLTQIPPQNIVDWKLDGYQGAILENFVANELMAAGCKNLFTWQGAQSEVDFVVEHRESPLALEVKSGGKLRAKSLGVLLEKSPQLKAYVLGLQEKRDESSHKFKYLPAFRVRELLN